MKKLTKILVVIFVVSVLALTLGACKKDCKGNHQLEKVDATVTCTQAGNIAYWKCSACNKLFKDAEAAVEITEDDLASEALGHDWGDWSGNTATCLQGGQETRKCSRCDATDTRPSSVLRHSFVKADGTVDTSKIVAAVSATCTEGGNVAYYKCDSCKHYFTVEGSVVTDKGEDISKVQIPASGHSFVKADGSVDTTKLVPAEAATCTEVGTAAHYLCEYCNHYFVMDGDKLTDKGTEISAIQSAATGHSFVKADGSVDTTKLVPAEAATCTEVGTAAHYLCEDCNHYFVMDGDKLTDKGLNISAIQSNALGHDLRDDWAPVANSNPAKHTRVCHRAGCDHSETVDCTAGTVWDKDATGHWHVCTVCEGTMDFTAHQSGALNCEVCRWVSENAVVTLTVGENVTYYASVDAMNTAILALFPADGSAPAAPISASVKALKNASADYIGAPVDEAPYTAIGNMNLEIDLDGHEITLAKGVMFTQGTYKIENGKVTCTNNATGSPIIVGSQGSTLTLQDVEIKATQQDTIALALLGGTIDLRGTFKAEATTALCMYYMGGTEVSRVRVFERTVPTFTGAVAYGCPQGLADGWQDKLQFILNGSVKAPNETEIAKVTSTNPVLTYANYQAFLDVLVGEDHTHEAVEGQWTQNNDPTYHFGVCECGSIVPSAKALHSWIRMPSHADNKAATCTENGVEVFRCTGCGQIKCETIPATGHTWNEWGNSTATCTAAGKETRSCSVCHEQEERDVAALGHDYVANVCSRGDSTMTEAQVLDLAAALASGKSLQGTYKLTGVVKSIDEAHNAQYNNITVTITVGSTDIKCYRLSGGADIAVGQTIAVTGEIENSGGKVQFKSASTYVRIWTDAEKVAADKDALVILSKVTAAQTGRELPLVGAKGSTIAWASNNAAIAVNAQGVVTVTPPATGSVKVTLTATITCGSVTDTRTFEVDVAKEWTPVTVEFTAPQHATMTVEVGGVAVADRHEIYAGETVVVTLTLDAGYKLASYTLNGGTPVTSVAGQTTFSFELTANVSFTVQIVEKYTTKTLAEFYSLENNTENIKVSGVVTGIDGRNVYIQDATSGKALLVYAANPVDERYVVGNLVTVAGKVSVYKGLYELVPTEILSSVAATPVSATELYEAAVAALAAGDASKLVTINGLVFQSAASGNYTFKKGAATIVVRPTSNSAAAKILEALEVGDTINIVNAFVGYYNNVQIALSKADQIEIPWTLSATVSNASVAVNSTVLVTPTVSPALVLNGIEGVLNGLGTAQFQSSNEDVATVNEHGRVTGVAASATPVTITVSLGGKTANVQVTVVAVIPTHTVTFNVNLEQCDVNVTVKADTSVALTESDKSVISEQGFTMTFTVNPKVGFTISSVKVGGTDVAFADGKYSLEVGTADMTVEIVMARKEGWILVSDVAELQDGDKIVIVNGSIAMSTTQNSNNRGSTAITASDGRLTSAPSADVQIITLEKVGTEGSVFKLRVGEGSYLYAVSGSNYLKSGAYPTDANAQAAYNWSISVGEKTEIVATIGSELRYLQFNNAIVSGYKNTQTNGVIYKLYPCATHTSDEWLYNAEKHWKVCSKCSDVFAETANNFTGVTWTGDGDTRTVTLSDGCVIECGGATLPHNISGDSCSRCGKAAEFNITVNAGENTALADFTCTGITDGKATANSTVSVTIAPSTGKVIASVDVVANGASVAYTKDGNVYTFTMPASNVTITVTTTNQGSKITKTATYTFTSDTSATGALGVADLATKIKGAKAGDNDIIASVSATNNVYSAKTGTDNLKFGSSSKPGSMTLVFDSAVTLKKIVITAKTYGSDSSAINVDGANSQSLTSTATPYEFTLDGTSQSVKINITGKRGYITEIVVTYEVAAQ